MPKIYRENVYRLLTVLAVAVVCVSSVDAGVKRSLALKDIQGSGAGRLIEGTEYKIELLSVLLPGRAMPFDRDPGPRPIYAAVRVSSQDRKISSKTSIPSVSWL